MAERITGHTERISLFAYPIRHSSSPAMHNAAFARLGYDYTCLDFDVDNDTLEDTIRGTHTNPLHEGDSGYLKSKERERL